MKKAQGMDWAGKVVEKFECGMCKGMIHNDSAAQIVKLEHARAVRIVKRAERMELRVVRDTDTNEYLAGYQQATSDILAALTKGRGKGGRRGQ